MVRLKDKHYGVASCVIRSLGRLGLGVLVARSLGTDGYALFVLLVATEVIVTTLCNALHSQPLLTIAPGLPESERGAIERHVRRQVGRLAAALLVGGVGVALVAGTFTDASPWTLLAFVAALAATVVTDCWRAIRQGRFSSRITVPADFVVYALPVAGLWLWGDGQPGDAGPGAQTLMWSLLLVGQLLAARLLRQPLATNRPSAATLRELRSVAVPFACGSAVVSLSSRTQPYVLAAVATSAELSWFGCAVSLMGPMRLLSGSLSAVLRPRMALNRAEPAGTSDALRKAWSMQLALGGALLLGCALFGTMFVRLVFGEGFAAVGSLLPLAVVFATMEGVGAVQAVAVQTRCLRGAHVVTRSRSWAGLVGVVLLAVLAPMFGASGALWALAAAEAVFLWQLLVPVAQTVNRARSMP